MNDDLQLHAGAARATITPPLGIYLVGYGDRNGGATHVHDDLTATVLVLDDGQSSLALIGLDILGLNWEVVERVQRAVALRTGIPAEHVLLLASHTHSGPVGYAPRHYGLPELWHDLRNTILMLPTGAQPRRIRSNRRYMEELVQGLARAAATAHERLAPVSVAYAQGQSDIGHNRRERLPNGRVIIGSNPGGPIDRSLTVLQFRWQERAPLTLVNFACHPTILGPNSYAISADWVGAMRRQVEAELGGLCLFLQGAAGDVNPQMEWSEDDLPEVAAKGERVAREVLRLAGQTSPLSLTPLALQRVQVWLPLQVPAGERSSWQGGYKRRLSHLDENDLEISGIPGPLIDPVLETRFPWKTVMEAREGRPHTPVEVNALRLGEVALTTVSMEPFTEIGVRVKESSPAALTLFAGYTNGLTGYLPSEEERQLGGYEVDLAPYFYRLPGPLPPHADDRVVNALHGLLAELYG